jgi:hypothetical protein
MKLLKVCAVLVAIAVLQNASFGVIQLVYEEANPIKGKAIGDPFTLGEPVIFQIADYDVGTIYSTNATTGYRGNPVPNDGGGVAAGAAAMDAIVAAQATGALPIAPYGDTLEDGWGVVRVTNIQDENGYIVWTSANKGYELLGVFYGIQDIHIEPSGVAVTTDRISGINFNIDLYSEAIGNWDPSGGTADRTGAGTYQGIGGGTLELRLNSLPGFIHDNNTGAGYATEFESLFNPTPGELVANALTYLEVDNSVGESAFLFDNDPFDMPAANAADLGPMGYDTTADMFGSFKADLTGVTSDWLLRSNDPIKAVYTPEPVTMLGLFMGLGGIGAYIRRRRMR